MTRGPIVCGETAADRLMSNVAFRTRHGETEVTPAQVVVVLRALADHTALLEAVRYRQPIEGPCAATSVGRFLHDTADQLTTPTPARAADQNEEQT